ncbi:MAG: SDR family oxidoreductase, partial [Myxococcota bacterium]|nr:SDR family oxidoreductase [Myxococcota bacterium]
SLLGGTGATQTAEPQTGTLLPEQDTALPLGRFVLDLVDAPARGLAQPGLWDEGILFVTDEGTGIAASVVNELSGRGIEAQLVDQVPEGAHKALFLGGLREVSSEEQAIAINREAFVAARQLAEPLTERGGLFVTVQDTGGRFGLGGIDPVRAWLSGAPALVKTAAQEWPLASVKAIDIERGDRDAATLATALVEELVGGGAAVEVALAADGTRRTLRSVAAEVVRGEAVIGQEDVVVVSGGARGVTAASIIAWAHDCRARFVLLGRTGLLDEPACCAGLSGDAELKRALLEEAKASGTLPKPAELGRQVRTVLANREIRSTLASIEAAGGQARYLAVDVTDMGGLGEALAGVRSEWGPITGIVHGAGVLADKRIAEKTDDQFDRVFDTKIEGLRALLAATADDPMKLLCFFSSVSARCGNNGQSDYAMANEVLNKVAQSESARRPDLHVKSLGWGPWEGGMVSPELKAHFASLGVPMIPLEVGGRMLADELHGSEPGRVELVMGGEPRAEALLFAGTENRVLTMELRLDRASHSFLSGHSIRGTAVVPVVLAVSWLSRMAESFRPDLELAALEQLKVLKGIRLDGFDGSGDRVVLTCQQMQNGDGALLSLEIKSSEGVPHYHAQARMVERSEPLQGGRPDVALDDWNGADVYDGDALFHDADFKVIERMDGVSKAGAAAILQGQDAGENPANVTNVAVYDGGLQVAILWSQHVLGGASLPTRIDEVRTGGMQTLPTGEIQCVVVGRELTRSRAVSDVVFVDEKGERVAELRGVETHLLPGAAAFKV